MAQTNSFPTAIDDPEKHERQLALPAATTRYAIYFTPRSGSSWLGDIAIQTKQLGNPGEPFNPPNVPVIAQRLNATDLDSYIDKLTRVRNTKGVFGFQITFGDIGVTFEGPHALMKHFQRDPCFWLIRENILLQAVSLSKKAQTRIGHTTQTDAAQSADTGAQYDAAGIKRFLTHIDHYERGTEAIFTRYKLAPLRLSYERMTQLEPIEVAQVIARHIGLPDMQFDRIEQTHEKLGTSLNREFAQRFRTEHPDLMAEIDNRRAPMLAQLESLETLTARQG